MRGRYRPFYLAEDYDRQVVEKGKCLIYAPCKDYKPLIGIVDFSSEGFRTSWYSWIAERPIELLSEGELNTVLYLHSGIRPVKAIYEQVAQLPDETRAIARDLGVKHPAIRGADVIMSTDFVIVEDDGSGLRRTAISFKREADLTERVFEKLEIDRVYWERRKIAWTLMLDTELPMVVVKNMQILSDWYSEHMIAASKEVVQLILAWIAPHMEKGVVLTTLCTRCDSQMRFEPGTSLGVAYHLMVRGIIPVDLTKPIHPCPSMKYL